MADYDVMSKVETAWITELNKNAYIIANSIPVIPYRNNARTMTNGIYVFARVPNTANDRYQDTFKVRTQVICYTNTPSDKEMEILRKYVDAVFNVAINTTLLDFSQSGNITINGVEFTEEHDEEYDDNHQMVSINLVTMVTSISN